MVELIAGLAVLTGVVYYYSQESQLAIHHVTRYVEERLKFRHTYTSQTSKTDHTLTDVTWSLVRKLLVATDNMINLEKDE